MSQIKPKTSTAKKVTQKSFSEERQTSATPEQRYQMIAEAAYFSAEKRGFDGVDVEQDWLGGEAEIDRVLQ